MTKFYFHKGSWDIRNRWGDTGGKLHVTKDVTGRSGRKEGRKALLS